jgi:hypothetical protein
MLYLGIYYNALLIPDSFIWKDNKPRTDLMSYTKAATIQALLLITEAGVLILVIYVINKLIIGDSESKQGSYDIANQTAKINIIVTICFIIFVLIGSFKH